MILWANIWMDVPPATALSVERAEPDVMHRNPRPPNQGVLTKINSMMILYQGFVMGLLALGTYLMATYNVLKGYDAVNLRQSLTYATLCCMQLSQSFLSRSVTESVFKLGVLGNLWLVAGVAVSLLFLLLGLYVPGKTTPRVILFCDPLLTRIQNYAGLNEFLTMSPLPGIAWAVIAVVCVIHFVMIEVFKVLARHLIAKNFIAAQHKVGFFDKA